MPYSILIVDDEALTLRTIGRALDGRGFRSTSSQQRGRSADQISPTSSLISRCSTLSCPASTESKCCARPRSALLPPSSHHDERLPHGRSRRGGDEAWRLRLPDQAVSHRRHGELRSSAPPRCWPCACAFTITVQNAKGRYDFGRVVTMSPVMRERAGDGAPRCRKRAHHDPDPRRKWYWQGSAGQGRSTTTAHARRCRSSA